MPSRSDAAPPPCAQVTILLQEMLPLLPSAPPLLAVVRPNLCHASSCLAVGEAVTVATAGAEERFLIEARGRKLLILAAFQWAVWRRCSSESHVPWGTL